MPRAIAWTARLLLSAALVCLTACDSGSRSAKPTASPSGPVEVTASVSSAGPLPAASPSTASPQSPASGVPSSPADAALDIYRQMMAAMVQASAISDPDFPLLAKYATGEALVSLRYTLTVNRQNGLVAKGPMRMAPQVVSVSPDGTLAKLKDCLDDTQWLRYKADGTLFSDIPGGRRTTDAEVSRADGTWKVSVLRVGATGTC